LIYFAKGVLVACGGVWSFLCRQYIILDTAQNALLVLYIHHRQWNCVCSLQV